MVGCTSSSDACVVTVKVGEVIGDTIRDTSSPDARVVTDVSESASGPGTEGVWETSNSTKVTFRGVEELTGVTGLSGDSGSLRCPIPKCQASLVEPLS